MLCTSNKKTHRTHTPHPTHTTHVSHAHPSNELITNIQKNTDSGAKKAILMTKTNSSSNSSSDFLFNPSLTPLSTQKTMTKILMKSPKKKAASTLKRPTSVFDLLEMKRKLTNVPEKIQMYEISVPPFLLKDTRLQRRRSFP